MSKLALPEAFIDRLSGQLPGEVDAFIDALSAPPITSIRRNDRKPSRAFMDAEVVPWCPSAAFLDQRPIFALDPLWHAGAYYVQEPSSLLLHHALKEAFPDQKPERVLDLCAAPGGKSTLLLDFLADDALLVANEVIRTRERILHENLIRWGSPNIVVTSLDPGNFTPLTGFFDLVVIDAPCSGEGLFRKERDAVKEWSVKATELCAARQERIVREARDLIAPGGILIYSTCTYNPAENDQIIERLLQGGEFEPVALPCPPEWGALSTRFGQQCWPHRFRGEGFYIAVLQRDGKPDPDAFPLPPTTTLHTDVPDAVRDLVAEPENYDFRLHPSTGVFSMIPRSLRGRIATVELALPRAKSGTVVATIKGKDVIPAHELAVSIAASPDLPSVELDVDTARMFLRKNTLTLSDDLPKGWLLMRYEKQALGWVKNMPGRVNNYLPNEWRLRL